VEDDPEWRDDYGANRKYDELVENK
jgi:hypothetical protein